MRSSLIVAARRLATRIEVGVVAIAILGAYATQSDIVNPRSVEFEVEPLATIVESPTSIGVADPYLYFSSPANINATLDALQSLGVQNVRMQIPWAAVQTWGPSSYDWTAADQMINAAAARNMGVLGVLNATPFWAGASYLNGQPNPQVYATFASAVASRYAGKISAYEIWNEPNSSAFLSPADPAGYTQLLKAAYPAIKAADPSATVIGGVVGSVSSFLNLTVSPEAFIAGMYSAGAKGSFDALSFHPYQYFLPFSAGAPVSESPLNQLIAIRQLMVANGDAALKVWATEYGEPTSAVTEQQQAAYLKDFLTAWQSEAGAGPVFVHTSRDAAINYYVDDTFGLFFNDWTPKLAAQVIKNFIAGNPDSTPPAIAVDVITQLTVIVSQATGIPLPFVALVAGVVRDVVNSINTVIQGIATFTQGVVNTITAGLALPAQSTPTPSPALAVTAPIAAPTGSSVRAANAVPVAADPAVKHPLTVTSVQGEVAAPSSATDLAAGSFAVAAPSSSSESAVSTQSTVPLPASDASDVPGAESTDLATPKMAAEPTVSSAATDPPTATLSPSVLRSPIRPSEPKTSLPEAKDADSSKTSAEKRTGTADAPTTSTHDVSSQSAASNGEATGTDSQARKGSTDARAGDTP